MWLPNLLVKAGDLDVLFFQKLLPQPTLLAPVERGRDSSDVPFADGVAARQRSRQEQNRFLNVGGQQQQVHDLRHTGAADLAEPSQFRLVGNLAFVDQPVET